MTPDETKKLEADKRIDPEQLDVEWIENGDRYHDWAMLMVEAESVMAEAELEADRIKSDLALQCRKNPKDFELEKVTEEAVKAAVAIDPRYLKAQNAYLDARSRYNEMRAAVETMNKKETALVNLVKLHGQQYFCGPSVPHDLVTVWEQHREKRSKSVDQRTQEVMQQRRVTPGR